MQILLVDDDTTRRHAIATMLLVGGWQAVQVGSTGEATLRLAETDQIGLVLTDVGMPGARDGVQFATLMRLAKAAMPILVLSHYGDGHSRRLEEIAPPIRFLPNPYADHNLLHAVRDLIRPPLPVN